MRAVHYCEACEGRLPYCVRSDRQFCSAKCRVWGQPHELLLHSERTETPHAGQSLNGAVTRVCASAGVPMVCPHSLRGLWATLGVESGAAESAVATALGHGSFEITARHYAQPETLTDTRSDRVAGFLNGNGAAEDLTALPAENLLAKLPQSTLDQLALLLARKPRSPSLREADHRNQ